VNTVCITLGGGFADHHVVIDLDGRKILDQAGVRSSPLTDLAAELPAAPVSGESAALHVIVRGPDRGSCAEASFTVTTERDRYVVLYVDRDPAGQAQIRMASSDKPMGFA
jgi:hypothetical protein